MSLNLPYYYGHSGEQYAFSRIPKLLLTDNRFAEISTDAKLLYGLLLDRMELSYRNGWIDEQNRVFIFCLRIDQFGSDDFGGAFTDVIHALHPQKLIFRFKLLCDAFGICHLFD